MGRQVTFHASVNDFAEIFRFCQSTGLTFYIQHGEMQENELLRFSCQKMTTPEIAMQKGLNAFIAKDDWPCIYMDIGAIDISYSEVIELQEFGNLELNPFGVFGFRLYVLMERIVDNAFEKKSEDFQKAYEFLVRFIKKYGMIDAVDKRDYIMPDAYRIYCEHPEEVKNAYTSFAPKKIKAWPKQV